MTKEERMLIEYRCDHLWESCQHNEIKKLVPASIEIVSSEDSHPTQARFHHWVRDGRYWSYLGVTS